MDPYEADPLGIPPTDRYADIPFYGRYLPRSDDFRVNPEHIRSTSDKSLQYWASVVERCNELVRIYPAAPGGRDVFALGSVIVKSSHLHNADDGHPEKPCYPCADANEIKAIEIAKDHLDGIQVPEIYFSGKIHGRQVLVQQRLPGVALTVAWQYLSHDKKTAFKQQARSILHQLYAVKPLDGRPVGSHVVQDPDAANNGHITTTEADILFSNAAASPGILGLAHNDLTESNIIVDKDKITGIIDWEMAGFFSWDSAVEVHRRIRTAQRESFAHLNLSEETMCDITFWNDLYDEHSQSR